MKRKIANWRNSLSAKGMKVNTGKTKVMISTAGAGETRKVGKFPCRVCGDGTGSNSIFCTSCHSWIHKRCSDITGDLSKATENFSCRKCQGRMPRPSVVGDGEHLEVEGERYGVVPSFCYLGDMLDGSGGAGVAVTARIRSRWKKYHELAPLLTSRVPSLKMKGRVFDACIRNRIRNHMIYASEKWPMTTDDERRITTADTRMMRRMLGTRLCKIYSNKELRELTGLEDISISLRRRRMRWYGHVMRRGEDVWIKKIYTDWNVPGPRPRGRPKKT